MEEGFIVVNKPKGITSFGVISRLRKITGVKKIGHCGTLDPLATGVLICAIGRSATKKMDLLLKKDKNYLAEIELGKISPTYDYEGELNSVKYKNIPKENNIENVLEEFIGETVQTPPVFSAKKINGKRAYDLARSGKKVKMPKRKIKIYKIKITSFNFPILKLSVSCGSGTYIRSLANDIGNSLGTGGVLKNLKRTSVGSIKISKAISLKKINEKNWKDFLLYEI